MKKWIALILVLMMTVLFNTAAFAAETGTFADALALNSTSLGLKKGETATLQVSTNGTVLDGVSWSSSNTGIATVSGGDELPETQTDTMFSTNYDAAKANDIKLGVYHVSYATTPEIAAQEAQMLSGLSCCSGGTGG